MFLMYIPATALAQTQLGGDIDGEAAGDVLSAVSLSSDGDRLAVGAEGNAGSGGISGHVRVFEWSGSDWVQLGADIDGEAPENRSGDAVSLSGDGNRVAIGAPSNHDNGEYSGHVRVFQWSGSAWTQMGTDIDGEAAYDNFGQSVSISQDGNRVAAISSYNDDAGSDFGHVRVFEWSGSDWVQLGADIDGKASDDTITSVSLSETGDHVALGARRGPITPGQARVYQWSGDAWVQLGDDIEGVYGDSFGTSVALSSDGARLAVGAPHDDEVAPYSGRTRVFEWSGSAWIQVGNNIDGDTTGAFTGHAVSLSSNGNRLAISGPGGGDDHGLVRIYQWSGSAWAQIGSDITGEVESDGFGDRVALSANGNRVAASAPWNDGSGIDAGHARVYDLSMFNVFEINPGLNDHWYNPATVGQGIYLTVFPILGKVTVTMFTYDTQLPDESVTANLGDPSQRWLNGLGNYSGNQAVLKASFDYDGLFDDSKETTKVRQYGTITLTFDSCNSGLVEYEIPSLSLVGSFPIERIVDDNVVLCEAFLAAQSSN
jgi:hypothetical protein